MSITVTKQTQLAKPADVAFDYVADYRTIPAWLDGISTFEPAGELDYGLGAVFDGALNLGVTTLHSTVKVTAFAEKTLIELESIKGFKNTSRWTFTPVSDTVSELTSELTYEFPGGLAGRAMGKVAEPLIAMVIKHSAEKLRKNIAAL